MDLQRLAHCQRAIPTPRARSRNTERVTLHGRPIGRSVVRYGIVVQDFEVAARCAWRWMGLVCTEEVQNTARWTVCPLGRGEPSGLTNPGARPTRLCLGLDGGGGEDQGWLGLIGPFPRAMLCAQITSRRTADTVDRSTEYSRDCRAHIGSNRRPLLSRKTTSRACLRQCRNPRHRFAVPTPGNRVNRANSCFEMAWKSLWMETVAQGISKKPLTSILLTFLAASRVGLPPSPGSAHVLEAPSETIHDRAQISSIS